MYGPAAIKARVSELDKKWGIERTLELNAGIPGIAGAVLRLTVDKRWAKRLKKKAMLELFMR